MSIQAMAAVIELQDLKPTRKLVLMMLANAYNQHTARCHPDQDRLAKECCVSISSIQAALKWLQTNKYIKRRTKHHGRGLGSTTHFDLLFLEPSFLRVQPDKTHKTGDIDPLQTLGGYKDKPEYKPETCARGASAFSIHAQFEQLRENAAIARRSGGLTAGLNELEKYVVKIDAGKIWVNARFIITKLGASLDGFLESHQLQMAFAKSPPANHMKKKG